MLCNLIFLFDKRLDPQRSPAVFVTTFLEIDSRNKAMPNIHLQLFSAHTLLLHTQPRAIGNDNNIKDRISIIDKNDCQFNVTSFSDKSTSLFFLSQGFVSYKFLSCSVFSPEFYDQYRPSFPMCFSWHKRSPYDLTLVSFT